MGVTNVQTFQYSALQAILDDNCFMFCERKISCIRVASNKTSSVENIQLLKHRLSMVVLLFFNPEGFIVFNGDAM